MTTMEPRREGEVEVFFLPHPHPLLQREKGREGKRERGREGKRERGKVEDRER